MSHPVRMGTSVVLETGSSLAARKPISQEQEKVGNKAGNPGPFSWPILNGWIDTIREHPKSTVILLGLVTLLPGLGNGYLWDRDETWYASCALHMVQSGDWLIPGIGVRAFLEKPPLAYWFMAGGFSVFGPEEFFARFPSVLFGTGVLLMVYLFSVRFLSKTMGLIAAGVLGTMLHFGVVYRAALMDPPLVLGITAALYCFWRMQTGTNVRYGFWGLLGGISMGFSILAKGPIGFLSGLIAVVYLFCIRDFPFFKRAGWGLVAGLAAIVAVALPWYLLVWHRLGDEFIDEFFLKRNIRLLSSPIQGHGGPVFYYLPVLFLGLMPWTFLLLASPFNSRPHDRTDLFLVCWAGIPFLLFSLIQTKLPHYVAPSIPPLAILCVREIEWRLSHPESAKRLIGFGFKFWVGTGGALCVFSLIAWIGLRGFPMDALLLPGAILTLGFLGVDHLYSGRKKHAKAFLFAGATMILLFLVLTLYSLPRAKALQVIPRAVSYAMDMAVREDGEFGRDEVFCYRHFEPSLFFYSRGSMRWGKEPEFQEFLSNPEISQSFQVLCRAKHAEEVASHLENYPVGEHPISVSQVLFNGPETRNFLSGKADRYLEDYQLRLFLVNRFPAGNPQR